MEDRPDTGVVDTVLLSGDEELSAGSSEWLLEDSSDSGRSAIKVKGCGVLESCPCVSRSEGIGEGGASLLELQVDCIPSTSWSISREVLLPVETYTTQIQYKSYLHIYSYHLKKEHMQLVCMHGLNISVIITYI